MGFFLSAILFIKYIIHFGLLIWKVNVKRTHLAHGHSIFCLLSIFQRQNRDLIKQIRGWNSWRNPTQNSSHVRIKKNWIYFYPGPAMSDGPLCNVMYLTHRLLSLYRRVCDDQSLPSILPHLPARGSARWQLCCDSPCCIASSPGGGIPVLSHACSQLLIVHRPKPQIWMWCVNIAWDTTACFHLFSMRMKG